MRFVRRPLLGAAVGLLTSTAVAAFGQSQGLTLQQAIAMGQQRGAQARSALSARDASRARDDFFFAQYLPLLSIGGTAPTYTRSITPVIQPDGSTLYRPLQQTTAGLTATVLQRVPWTNTTFNFSSGLSQVQVSGATGIKTWSSTPLTIGISQPILRANTQRWDRSQQELRFTSSERRYLESREDVGIAVTGAYYDLYSATVTLRNASANALTNDTLYTLNKGRYEVGKIGENDLLQSELALLRSRAALEDARLTNERALSQFRIVLGLQPGAMVELAASAVVPDFEADTTIAVQQARRNSSVVTDAELSEVSADRAVSEARWNTGGGGNLSASYGYNATAASAPDAYKNLLDARQLSLSVQVPVWQWGAHSAQVQAAKADRESAKSTAQNTRAQTEHNARFAALQLSQARRSLVIAAKADTVAAKRFEVALNRYVIGRIAIDNLYLAQNEKDQALSSYVQALRAYWTAYFQLRKTTLYDFERGEPIK